MIAGVALLLRFSVFFAVAVLVNYVWELAQAPLYVGVELPAAMWHCFIAALGDGLLVLAIFAAVAIATGDMDWYVRPGMRGYTALAAAGLAVGFAVEWWGLHIARRWQYSDLMPVIPETGIGAAPVLQMLLLPPAIFWIVRRFAR